MLMVKILDNIQKMHLLLDNCIGAKMNKEIIIKFLNCKSIHICKNHIMALLLLSLILNIPSIFLFNSYVTKIIYIILDIICFICSFTITSRKIDTTLLMHYLNIQFVYCSVLSVILSSNIISKTLRINFLLVSAIFTLITLICYFVQISIYVYLIKKDRFEKLKTSPYSYVAVISSAGGVIGISLSRIIKTSTENYLLIVGIVILILGLLLSFIAPNILKSYYIIKLHLLDKKL